MFKAGIVHLTPPSFKELEEKESPCKPTALRMDGVDITGQDARWAISRSRCTDGGASVARALRAGTLQAVGDGSLKGGFGTSAFVLEAPGEASIRVQGVNIVPGPLAEGDSHRCELASLYAILLVSQAVCKTHHITQGKATIACDNKQAISMFNEWYVPDPQDANFDLTSAIWKLLQDSPIQWQNIHVKGHQDDHLQCDKLNRVAQLNVEMDRLAKSFWRHCYIHQHTALQPLEPPQHPIHLEGWTLWHGNTKVINPNRQHLYELIHNPITTSKWVRLG